MENSAWVENYLQSNGFVKSHVSAAVIEFMYPYENGDSSFFQIWLKEHDTLRISINHDFSGIGESNFILLPQTISDLKSLLRIHGIIMTD